MPINCYLQKGFLSQCYPVPADIHFILYFYPTELRLDYPDMDYVRVFMATPSFLATSKLVTIALRKSVATSSNKPLTAVNQRRN